MHVVGANVEYDEVLLPIINFWCENSCFTVQGVLFGTGAQ